jgi:Asp-tRNA(Asn)/Glu-tRNA(Gln) amidotransferase A subunit family amidase
MVPAALGTQVVGSILRPASFCGCVGYKPTVGGINRGGSYDYFSQSCTGTLAASLEDAWIVAINIAAHAGGDPGYPGIQGPPRATSTSPPACARAARNRWLGEDCAGGPPRVTGQGPSQQR